MEMHSRQSLYEIHGISAPRRRQKRRRPLDVSHARIFAVLKRIRQRDEAELASPRHHRTHQHERSHAARSWNYPKRHYGRGAQHASKCRNG